MIPGFQGHGVGQGGIEVEEQSIFRVLPGSQGVFGNQPLEMLRAGEALQILLKQLHQRVLVQKDLAHIGGIVGL